MLIYIDMEHEHLREIDRPLWQQARADLMRNKYRFERISGRSCLIVNARYLAPSFIRKRTMTAFAPAGSCCKTFLVYCKIYA